jgi:hypothetical protein
LWQRRLSLPFPITVASFELKDKQQPDQISIFFQVLFKCSPSKVELELPRTQKSKSFIKRAQELKNRVTRSVSLKIAQT